MDLGELFPVAQSQPIPIKGIIQSDTRDFLSIQKYAIGREWYKLKQGEASDKYFSLKKACISKPSQTITKMAGIISIASVTHPFECRKFNISELRSIGSYPSGYEFSGIYSDSVAHIGNSVPPLLTKAIATQIRHKLWSGDKLKPYPKTTAYAEILDHAWQQHLAPKEEDAPTVISTFAGGGGSSLGYSMAGYKELLAVEWDNNAVETFKLNFPDIPVYHGDIAKLSVEECMKLAGLTKEGELDLFEGSPPCQGFSISGKRDFGDSRNQLFKEYIRLLRGLKPKVFLMENVSGMVKGKMKLIFAEILRELKASGYQVSARLMNAKYFYVPQSRERLIFIGVRNDIAREPSHPKAESKPIGAKVIEGARNDGINGKFLALEGKTSNLIKMLKPGQRLEQLYEQIHGKGNKAYFAFSRTHPNRPTRTIAKDSAGLFHYSEDRTLTIGEYKRIGSFPDPFQFIGSFSSGLKRIGNSVPPLFMRSIAQHIKANILK